MVGRCGTCQRVARVACGATRALRGEALIGVALVARWVANECLGASFRVALGCSPSVFWLVTAHSCWSWAVPGLHGMQEVWGSNPHSSTQRSSRFSGAYFHVWV